MSRIGLAWRRYRIPSCLGLALLACIAIVALRPALARNLASVCAVGGGAGLCDVVLPMVCPGGGCTWLSYRGQTALAAEGTLRAAAVGGPSATSATFHLGELMMEQGRAAEAVSVWKTVPYAEMRPAQEAAVTARAGRMAEAEQFMAISMAVMPLPSYSLGASYSALCEGWRTAGMNARALPWCRLALYAGGDNWAGLDAASASLAMGDPAGALLLAGALTASSQGKVASQAWRITGEAYVASSEPRKAVEAYRRALDLGAADQWTRMGLATALIRTGDLAGACEQVAAARSMGYALSAGQAVEFKDCVAGGRL